MQSSPPIVPAASAAENIPIATSERRAALCRMLEGVSRDPDTLLLEHASKLWAESTPSKIAPPGDLTVDGTSTSSDIKML